MVLLNEIFYNHYYKSGHLSRFQSAGGFCPGWQNRDKMSLALKNICALWDWNPRPIAQRMACLPTHLSSTCDSVKNNSLLNYHVKGPFVRVGNTNRDKRDILSRVEPPTGTKGSPISPDWCYQPGQKGQAFCLGWRRLHPGQKSPIPSLARLAVRPGTKVLFGFGSNSSRDK